MTVTLPRHDIRPAWRAAVLAYRLEYRATREDRFARDAAFEAFRKVLTDMPEEQAGREPLVQRLRAAHGSDSAGRSKGRSPHGQPAGVVSRPRNVASKPARLRLAIVNGESNMLTRCSPSPGQPTRGSAEHA